MIRGPARRSPGRLPLVFPVLAGAWVAALLWQSVGLLTSSTNTSADLGPAVLPGALGVLVLALLVADVLGRWRARTPHPDGGTSDVSGRVGALRLASRTPLVRFGALAVAAAVAGPWIGLAVTLPLLILGCLRLVEHASWGRTVLTTVALAGGLYVTFVVLLQVPVDLLPAY